MMLPFSIARCICCHYGCGCLVGSADAIDYDVIIYDLVAVDNANLIADTRFVYDDVMFGDNAGLRRKAWSCGSVR